VKTNGDADHEDEVHDPKQPSSPLPAERRLSVASLDNVNLEDSIELNGDVEKCKFAIRACKICRGINA